MQLFMYVTKSNGVLENESASTWVLPGQYLMSKLKSANSPIQHSPVALSFAEVRTYVNGLLSVYTL